MVANPCMPSGRLARHPHPAHVSASPKTVPAWTRPPASIRCWSFSTIRPTIRPCPSCSMPISRPAAKAPREDRWMLALKSSADPPRDCAVIPLNLGESADDKEFSAVDKAGRVGSQEYCGFGDVVGLADAPRRDL